MEAIVLGVVTETRARNPTKGEAAEGVDVNRNLQNPLKLVVG